MKGTGTKRQRTQDPPPSDATYDRPLPASFDAERSVLGACLLDREAYYTAALNLRPDDFALDSNRRIFRSMLALDSEDAPIDLVTVAEQLRATKEVEVIGGIAYLSSLTEGMPVGANVEHYCKLVNGEAKRRQIIFAAQAMMSEAFDGSELPDVILARRTAQLLDILASTRRLEVHHVKDYVHEMFAEMRQVAERPKKGVLGLTLGVPELDEITSGMQPGEQVVVGAYSGEGKTLFCGQVVYDNCCNGVPVLVFTQEMTKEQYLRRMIPQATDGNFPASMLRDYRELEAALRGELNIAEAKLASFPLWTVDASQITYTEMNAIARSYIRKHAVKIVVCDYVQLVRSDIPGEEDYQRVTKAAEMLRAISKDEKVNTVVVSQLTWPPSKRKTVPNMGLLRGSGDIAQGAHIILFPYRPEAKGYFTGKDQIRIGKMREGGRSPVNVELDRTRLRYVPRDKKAGADDEGEE